MTKQVNIVSCTIPWMDEVMDMPVGKTAFEMLSEQKLQIVVI